jgi:4-hydroxybenzoate polyprenyltransferase
VNDVADVDYDVGHPVKRLRPVASGELGTRAALVAAGVLAAVALALAAALGPASLVLLASFLAVQLAYTMRLKRLVVVDLLVLAALYVFRSAAGALAVDVRLSPWLVACTTLLALFLALQKRRGELLQVGAAGTTGRRALSGYTLQRADGAAAAVLVTTLATYLAYTLVATPPAMVVTVPLVAFGLARYTYLVQRRGLGEEPERILVEDVPLLATIAAWAAVSAAILAHG